MSDTDPDNAAMRDAARVADAVRRGWPVRITGSDGTLELVAVEGAEPGDLVHFGPVGRSDLLLSAEGAATLRLGNQAAAAQRQAVRITDVPHDRALAIADPARDLDDPLKGPWTCTPLAAIEAADAAMVLARHVGILPAFHVRDPAGDAAITATADAAAVRAIEAPARLRIASSAHLPIAALPDGPTRIVAFRSPEAPLDHVALVIGVPDGSPPVVRVHSECLTGDVLGSLKCDCGPQLSAALASIARAPWGILLYLRQEGRGIGLANKLRAYALQDQGYDTVDANLRLGMPVEARDFAVAARMLACLDVDTVRLLTNNPDKVAGLTKAGITVLERVPLSLPPGAHNAAYLATKRDRTGHLL